MVRGACTVRRRYKGWSGELTPYGEKFCLFFFFQAEDGIRYLTVTGVQTCALPISFASDEDTPGHNVVLLSYGLWQRRYGGVSSILGQTIDIDRQPYTVVGVMPQKFEFPLPGPDDNGSPADLWVPMAFVPAELQGWGGSYLTSVVGRLRPGITLEQVRGSTEPLAREVLASYPAALTKTFRAAALNISAFPFQEDVVGSVRTLLLVLMAAVS